MTFVSAHLAHEKRKRDSIKNFFDFMEEKRVRPTPTGSTLVALRQEGQDAPLNARGIASSRLWFRSKAG